VFAVFAPRRIISARAECSGESSIRPPGPQLFASSRSIHLQEVGVNLPGALKIGRHLARLAGAAVVLWATATALATLYGPPRDTAARPPAACQPVRLDGSTTPSVSITVGPEGISSVQRDGIEVEDARERARLIAGATPVIFAASTLIDSHTPGQPI